MATPWTVPPTMWAGKTVVILASGPSMSPQVVDAVVASGAATIAINDTAKLHPTVDLLYAADARWWNFNCDWALKHSGIKVTASSSVPFPIVKYLQPTGKVGYDPTPGKIRTGLNSGYQAVHVAMQAGAKKILLCGMDHTVLHGTHWHGDHPRGFSNPNESLCHTWTTSFRTLAQAAAVRGITIYNCSPISTIDCVPKLSLEEALCN